MREIDIRTALREAMDEEMARDTRVVLLGEEVAQYQGAYKVSKGLLEKYGPDRVIDTPISEAGFTGMAIGAAMTGLRPIVEFMSFNFSLVAADQIISHAAKMHYMSGGRFSVPIVFRGPNGAAAQVSCQHSHCVEALYAQWPGLKIVAPSCPNDAKGLLKAAIRDDNPVLVLENELQYSKKGPVEDVLLPIGKARVVRPGTDVTLIAHSRMVDLAEEVAQREASRGVAVEVVDLRTIKPLDRTTLLTSVHKTGRCVVVEEGHQFGGIAAEVIAQLHGSCLDAPIARVCSLETPLPYAKNLEAATLPNVARIEAVLKTLR